MKLNYLRNMNEIELRIQTLLYDVGLSSCYNTTIGSYNDRIILSGGERKRLAFITEVRCY
jgi:ABC-type dipeptide/oligopeptide/nickel transport system ATPase subunit